MRRSHRRSRSMRAGRTLPEPERISQRRIIARRCRRRLPARVFSTTAEAETIWRAKDRHFHRRAAARAKAAKSSRRYGLARQAAAQHSRQRLAAGYRLRQAGGGDRRLSAARSCCALPAATMPRCSWSIARPIAGCPGTRPSESCPTAIAMSRGIRTAPTAGSAPTCRLAESQPEPRAGEERPAPRRCSAAFAIPSPAGWCGRARTAAGRSRSAPRRRI